MSALHSLYILVFLWHQANSNRVQEDLESEFTSLHSVLDEMKENMMTRIKQERASRTYELQVAAPVFFCVKPNVKQTFLQCSM